MTKKKTNILLVEDEKSHAELICRAFEHKADEISLTVACNLHEAHNSISKSTPDLIIVDYVLPDGKGIELLPQEKEESPYPVIIMTSHGDERLAVEAMKTGALDYIVKSKETFADMPRICDRILREWDNITKLKKAEEVSQRLGQILDSSLNEIYVFDAETLRFIQVNKGARANLGYSMDELLNLTPLDLKPELTYEAFAKLVGPLRTGEKEKIQFETIHKRKDSSLYEVEVHLQLSSFDSTPAFVAIILDVTERKKMEEEIVKMQKLDSIGVLAGGIAHDFNNYLQGIMGYINLAQAQAGADDNVQRALKGAQKIIFQSKELSQRLITFSKGGDPTRKTIFVSQLIKDSVALAMGSSHLDCQIGVPDNLWPVEADKGQMNQVFTNIVINAKQAMPNGGKLNVFAENIEIKEKDLLPLDGGKYVKVTFKDQGMGISHEDLQKIFDPFFTTKESGNGLGLATCFSIIKKHGGHISVESELGVSTTFYIYLPTSMKVMPELGEAEIESTEKASINGRGKILLTDDEDTFRAVTGEH